MLRREYKILPQVENGSMYSREEDPEQDSPRSCLISCLLLLTTIFIFSGVVAILITFIWPKEFHTVVDNYWSSHPFYFRYHWPDNLTNLDSSGIVTENPILRNSSELNNNGSWTGSPNSGEDNISSSNVTNSHGNTNSSNNNYDDVSNNSSGEEINETNVGRKFAEAMRRFEKEMEKLSGIHQAELVIPLFMLVTLMSTLALISMCCCLMSKRREQRQRKLLGKIITDLQTGDKTVLLGGKDDGEF